MKQAIEEIPDRMAAGAGKDWGSGSADALLQEWLDADRPDKVIGALDRALEDGARLVPLADVLARAGIYRVAHYPAANEEDWDSVLHVMSYNNALAGLARRIAGLGPAAEQELMRGVFHGAHFVHLNYFLNIPRARLPRERNPDGVPAGDAEALCERLLWCAEFQQVDEAGLVVHQYLAAGHSEAPLLRALVKAVIREDAGFHTYQMLEAGIQQFRTLGRNHPDGRLALSAAARYISAQRARRIIQSNAQHALMLRRGEEPVDA